MRAPDYTFQASVITDAENKLAAGESVLLVSPTGSGKTVMGTEIINHAVERRESVLVLAHRREIILQTSQKLFKYGVRHGIIQAGFDPRPMDMVQVASVATLFVRAIKSDAMLMPPAKLVVIDEAHHTPARSYQIDVYPEAKVIGLTATPCRSDGRGLGGIFSTIVEAPQGPELIERGVLVPTRVYAPVDPDLKGIATTNGDYAIGQLAERVNSAKLVGDIVVHWLKHAERRKTVVFAVDVAHSIHIRDEMVRAGVRAEHIDGGTPKAERDDVLGRLRSGDIDLVTNCMVLTEGWDLPDIGCVILARPTKQLGLYRQMVGRGLRANEGKTDCIVLDHSGACFRHGLPEDRVEWVLDPDKRATFPEHAKRSANRATSLLECAECGALRKGGLPCPVCRWMPKRPARAIDIADGDLALVGHRAPEMDRQGFFAELRGYAAERGHKNGWAAHKFKERFGVFPPWSWNGLAHQAPSPATRAWIRSRTIAWAKRRVA